jgi:hypothetical protein
MAKKKKTAKETVDEAVGKKTILGENIDGNSINAAVLLDQVAEFTKKFVAYPSAHAHVAHVLWIVHAHLMEAWESTPRLAFLSPEPASGKTRALEVTELLVPNPVEAVNVSPAYLFRKVGADGEKPTILFDEIDTVFGPKAKENEEVRGLLNAGHRRGAVAGRCVVRGKEVMTEEIPAFSAVALAGLGWLPDTILSRSIIIRMRRRAPNERVTAFRRRVHAPQGHALRDRLAAWARTKVDEMTAARPEMPPGIEDRPADVWESLLAIADGVGGEWLTRARDAAVALVKAAEEAEPSLRIRLLVDLKAIFDASTLAAMQTPAILQRLHAIPESPWNDLKGRSIDNRKLAVMLRQFGISSRDIFVSGKGMKGYYREDLHDVWLRYLPPKTPHKRDERDEGDTPSETQQNGAKIIADNEKPIRDKGDAERDETNVAENIAADERDARCERDENSSTKSTPIAGIADIADVGGDRGEGGGSEHRGAAVTPLSARLATKDKGGPREFFDAQGKPTDDQEESFYGRAARAQFDEAYRGAARRPDDPETPAAVPNVINGSGEKHAPATVDPDVGANQEDNSMSPRNCAACGKAFEPARADAQYCSVACRQSAYRARVTDSVTDNVTDGCVTDNQVHPARVTDNGSVTDNSSDRRVTDSRNDTVAAPDAGNGSGEQRAADPSPPPPPPPPPPMFDGNRRREEQRARNAEMLRRTDPVAAAVARARGQFH